MDLEAVYSFSFLLVAPFWVLAIAAPRWSWTMQVLRSPLIALPAAILYTLLLLTNLGASSTELLNPTLSTVAALLGTSEGATLAWAHFLTFDLFAGRWVYLDSRAREANTLLMGIILFLVLMVGPLGLLVYLVIRSWGRVARSE